MMGRNDTDPEVCPPTEFAMIPQDRLPGWFWFAACAVVAMMLWVMLVR